MDKFTMEFARRDDCLEQMVPSDLRQIIGERDRLRTELERERGYSEGWKENVEDILADNRRIKARVRGLEKSLRLRIRNIEQGISDPHSVDGINLIARKEAYQNVLDDLANSEKED